MRSNLRSQAVLVLAIATTPLLLGQGCPTLPPGETPVAEDLTYAAPEGDAAIDGSIIAGAIAEGQQGPADVMREKLDQAIQTLLMPGNPPELQMRAIDQGVEARNLSNLQVLRTAGDPETVAATNEMAEMRHQMTEEWVAALTAFINNPDLGTPETRAYAFDVRNFEQVVAEALAVIETQTAVCPPDVAGTNCPLLIADDEGGLQLDTVLPTVFAREVRGPFWWGLQGQLNNAIQEQVILPGVMAPGECSPVLKEFQGIKAVVTRRIIPIWVEPWFARARIVGFKVVWVWEFVPAEFLKTITYCNVGNGVVTQRVDTRIVLERQLMHFWTFLKKDITEVSN